MICPKCGEPMMECGVGGVFTDQLIFYNCSNCDYMCHPFLDTKEQILKRIEEIDKEVEEYETEWERKLNKKWWEFWK